MEGFGWFTFEITKRMVLSHPEHTFYFFFDRIYDEKFVFAKNVKPIVLKPQARHPILFKIWFNYSVTKALTKYNIDLFFSPDGYLSLKSNVKQVGVIHDLNFEHYPQDIPLWPRVYLRTNFRKFAKKATHLITVSEYSKQDIVSLYGINPSKITVAYNAASEYFKIIEDSDKVEVRKRYTHGTSYFVYVGAIHKRKNINRLIKAFQLFKRNTKSNTKLLIVGENLWSNESKFDKQLKSDILFTGHVKIDELSKIVGSAKALCLVSYFEGFGIPLVEAMQAGVPLIAGNKTALPEISGDAAILVDPFSVEDIANGLFQLDRDESLRKGLIEKGLARSKSFNWQKSADLIWCEIDRLTKK